MGQERKPHILGVSSQDHVRLHTQCSNRPVFQCEEDEGGENRESKFSLAQPPEAINAEIGSGCLSGAQAVCEIRLSMSPSATASRRIFPREARKIR